MTDNLIVEAEYNWNENNEYVSVTVKLTDGSVFTTKNMQEVGEIVVKQIESTKLLEEASAMVDLLVREE